MHGGWTPKEFGSGARGTLLVVNEPDWYRSLLDETLHDVRVVTDADGPVDTVHAFVVSREDLNQRMRELEPRLREAGDAWIGYREADRGLDTETVRERIEDHGYEVVSTAPVGGGWTAARIVPRET